MPSYGVPSLGVLTMYGGKTVETGNSDAEGRLGGRRAGRPRRTNRIWWSRGHADGACVGSHWRADHRCDDQRRGDRGPRIECCGGSGEDFWHCRYRRRSAGKLDSTVADLRSVSGDRWGGAWSRRRPAGIRSGGHPLAHLDIAVRPSLQGVRLCLARRHRRRCPHPCRPGPLSRRLTAASAACAERCSRKLRIRPLCGFVRRDVKTGHRHERDSEVSPKTKGGVPCGSAPAPSNPSHRLDTSASTASVRRPPQGLLRTRQVVLSIDVSHTAGSDRLENRNGTTENSLATSGCFLFGCCSRASAADSRPPQRRSRGSSDAPQRRVPIPATALPGASHSPSYATSNNVFGSPTSWARRTPPTPAASLRELGEMGYGVVDRAALGCVSASPLHPGRSASEPAHGIKYGLSDRLVRSVPSPPEVGLEGWPHGKPSTCLVLGREVAVTPVRCAPPSWGERSGPGREGQGRRNVPDRGCIPTKAILHCAARSPTPCEAGRSSESTQASKRSTWRRW